MATGSMMHYAGGGAAKVRYLGNGVLVHGSTEPILSDLKARGFPIEDLFLMGFGEECGHIVFPSRERAEACAKALEEEPKQGEEPKRVYETKIGPMRHPEYPEEWRVDYDLRDPDGSVRSHLVTGLWLKDKNAPGGERQVMKDGRWIDGREDR